MFEHKWASIPKIRQVNSDSGRLYEVEGEGKAYPSITSVLGGTANKDSLHRWRQRVGEKKADQISQAATRRGTKMHSLCEQYLLNNELDDEGQFDAQLLFNNIKPLLNKITTVRCLETGLFSDKLKVAGTVDCVAEYDGKLTVIDFKTSNKPKKVGMINDYFLQGCFYWTAYYELTGEMPDQIAILISNLEGGVQEFIIPKGDIIPYVEKLRERIKTYVDNTNAS